MKRIKKISYVILASFIICMISCANRVYVSYSKEITLSSHFKGLFHLGAAINEDIILGNDQKSQTIVSSEFNSITPENSLKWMFLQPEPNRFNFEVADKYVELGLKNNMYIVGHALVWHSQLADFMQIVDAADKFIPQIKIISVSSQLIETNEKNSLNLLGLAKVTLRIVYNIPALKTRNLGIEVDLFMGG